MVDDADGANDTADDAGGCNETEVSTDNKWCRLSCALFKAPLSQCACCRCESLSVFHAL